MFALSSFCATFTVFAVYSQLFAFAFAKYRLMDNMQDMWLVFVGISSGAAAGITLFKVGSSPTFAVRDYVFILTGNVSFVIGLGSLLLDSQAFFFIGSGFIGAGLIFFFPMAESFYTKKISQYACHPQRNGLLYRE